MQTAFSLLHYLAAFWTLLPTFLLCEGFHSFPSFILGTNARVFFTSAGNTRLGLAVKTDSYRATNLGWWYKLVAARRGAVFWFFSLEFEDQKVIFRDKRAGKRARNARCWYSSAAALKRTS